MKTRENLAPPEINLTSYGRMHKVSKSSANFLSDPNYEVPVAMLLQAGSNSAGNVNIANRPTKSNVFGLICS